MHKRFFNAVYIFNVVIQSIISLASPIAVGVFISWLLTEKAGVDSWIYIVFIMLGVISGLVSMVRFLLSSMAGIQRLENEQRQDEIKRKKQMRERSVTDKNEEKQ